jgi:hypothetical protein
MTEKKVYRFGAIARAKPALNKMKEKSRGFRLSGHILCPGNGARSALRSLLSVALSSVRACHSTTMAYFYHWTVFRY